ncbi:MAG: hypothetical protein AB7E72_22245, partial [Lysobacterales bacterium]
IWEISPVRIKGVDATDLASAAEPIAVTTARPMEVQRTPDSPPRPHLAFDSVSFLAELPGQLDAIAKRAQSGDLRALNELADWLEYCDTAAYVQSRAAARPVHDSDLGEPAVAAYFKQLSITCVDWTARQPWLSDAQAEVAAARADLRAQGQAQARSPGGMRQRGPLQLSAVLRRRAADAGDELARSLLPDRRQHLVCGERGNTASGAEFQDHWKCTDRAAREALRLILLRRDPRELEQVPVIIGAYGTHLWNRSEFLRQPGEVATAPVLWILAACQFGLNCSATGRALRLACSYGICGYAQYWDYAADRLLPPSSARLVQQQLPVLVALIQAGDVDAILGPPPG